MLDPAQIPAVAVNEQLARFILFSRHIRSSNQTVKPDAFIPHPHSELSMMRHLQATVRELWQEGHRVALLRKVPLHGRADVEVSCFVDQGLRVEPAPIPENPNHVNALNWPAEKPDQKMKALLISEKSRFVPLPHEL